MKIKNAFTLAFFIVFGALFFVACTEESDDPEPTDNSEKFTYSTHAEPILTNFCATTGCHVSGAQVGSLANYNDAKAFVQVGRIMGSIKHDAGFSPMPKGQAKLSDQVIETIQQWIDDGLRE
jgi:hypothetical protein